MIPRRGSDAPGLSPCGTVAIPARWCRALSRAWLIRRRATYDKVLRPILLRMDVMPSFEGEMGRVARLMERLGIAPDEYQDPNATRAGETGGDVIAIIGSRRIGIQVTDLDTGEVP